ncbi:MAG: SOS response-associated peptidase [Janthinobacterium lividum]
MCGRFTLYHSTEEIAERFEADEVLETEARYNIAPTQDIAVVTQNGTRHLSNYYWGLIPSWAKDPAIGSRMINARAETLAEKPSFRTALTRRRCLIPADGFYEWQAAPSGTKAAKTPMYLHRKDSGLFAFAGLWDEWHTPDGSPLRSCTIITTTPNAVAAQVHDRMPVILRLEDENLWLDTSVTDTHNLLSLLVPYPAEEMEAYAVSRQVNVPMVDEPGLLTPADRLQ